MMEEEESQEPPRKVEAKVLLETQIPTIGHCKECESDGRGRTFICEDPKGDYIGACQHEITNTQLLKQKFGQYLTIVKQSTKNWPQNDIIRDPVLTEDDVKPKKGTFWVKEYMNVTEKLKITIKGDVYIELLKFNKKTNALEVYMQMKMKD